MGYFDTAAELKPLLHLWSLSIEEQFYIFWPLFLGVVWRFRQFVPVFHALLIACLTSFSLNILEMWGDPSGLFYSPQTRFWELAFGAGLAWISRQKAATSQLPACTTNTFSFVGLALIGISFFSLTKTTVFPGFLALLPVLGASLIVAAGPSAWPNARVLSTSVLVWVGRISFPLYLWHWPLLAYANILEDGSPHAAVRLGLVALAVVLSWLTVEWVEKPIRHGALSVSVVSVLAIGLLSVGSLGYGVHQKAVHVTSAINYGGIQRAVDDWEYPGTLQRYNTGSHVFLRHPNQENFNTLFIGDSNMEMYSARTDELLKTNREPMNGAIFATRGGCLPILDVVYDQARQPCAKLMQGAFDLAAADETVRNVVIAAQWNGYFSVGYGLQGDYGSHGKDTYKALQSFSRSIRLLTSQGKHVFVILNIPTGKEFDPKWLVSRGLRNFPRLTETRAGGTPRSAIDEQFGGLQHSIRRLAEAAGATVINPMDYVCTHEYCPSVDATGEPMYKDGYHLRASYVRRNAHFIDGTLKLQK